LAARFGCGEVAGVFGMQAGAGPGALLAGLLPLAAVPVLIAGAAARVPGVLSALGAFPFLFGAWYGLSLWRALRRVWFYAFAGGSCCWTIRPGTPSRCAGVRSPRSARSGPVYSPASEEPRTAVAAYRLRTADGQAHEISRSFKNVQDPYLEIGQLFRHLAPAVIGKSMPTFPTIGQIIAAYAWTPGPGA
jgi:hypothetical protein